MAVVGGDTDFFLSVFLSSFFSYLIVFSDKEKPNADNERNSIRSQCLVDKSVNQQTCRTDYIEAYCYHAPKMVFSVFFHFKLVLRLIYILSQNSLFAFGSLFSKIYFGKKYLNRQGCRFQRGVHLSPVFSQNWWLKYLHKPRRVF